MIDFSSTTILPLAPKIPIKKTKQNILQRCGIMVPTEQGESTQEIIFVSTRLLGGLKWLFNEPCFKIMSLIVIVPFEICLLGKKVLKNRSWDLCVLSMPRKEPPQKNSSSHQRRWYCDHVLRSRNQMFRKMLPCCIVNATCSLFLAH